MTRGDTKPNASRAELLARLRQYERDRDEFETLSGIERARRLDAGDWTARLVLGDVSDPRWTPKHIVVVGRIE